MLKIKQIGTSRHCWNSQTDRSRIQHWDLRILETDEMSFGTRNRAIATRERQRFEPSVVLSEVDYLESRIIIGKRYNFLKHPRPSEIQWEPIVSSRYLWRRTSFPGLARMVRNCRNLVTAFVASETQQFSWFRSPLGFQWTTDRLLIKGEDTRSGELADRPASYATRLYFHFRAKLVKQNERQMKERLPGNDICAYR